MRLFHAVGRFAPAISIVLIGLQAACSDTSSPIRINAGNARASVAGQGSGLVAAFGFDEASGATTADASGNNNTGTLGSGVVRTTSGKFGSAMVFSGNYVTVPSATSLNLTTAMTLEAWVNPATATSAWRDVIYKGDDNYYLMATSANNALPAGGASFGNTAATVEAFGTSPLAVNRWTHLAITYDGATLRLYVDGALVSSRAQSGAFTTSTNPLRIGGNEFYGQFFSGLIDEVRVYSRALSAAEIQTDMNTPVSADTQAPTVNIASPTTASTYSTTTTPMTLSGNASDNVGVMQVTWTNSTGGSGTASGTTAWSASIPLVTGSNVVTITARDTANNVATATLTVTKSVATPTGLVAAYGFGEASGTTVLDGSGAGNVGTLGSGATRAVSGRFGGALQFNGSGMVTIPNAPSLQLTTAMTLEAWVNPATATSAWRDVIYKGDDNYYLMATSANNALPAGGASFGNTAATVEAFGTSPLAVNRWTHLAITYDGATLRLYVDGALVSSRVRSGAFTTSTNPLRIGGNEFYGQFFSGLIDEVRIYNRPLSVTEIQSDMTTPVGGAAQPTDQTPPSVAISAPQASGTYATTALQVGLSGVANDSVGVTQVRWTNSRGGAGTCSGTTNWSAPTIPLQAGTNVITVTAQDAANNVANTVLTVVNNPTSPTATQVTITVQPSTSAQAGVAFAQQPVVQLRDASNNAVSQSGVVVTASIATGGGTLGGTTTATTNASGVASFTNLSITGANGARTLQFAAPSLTAVTSSAITVSNPTPTATALTMTTQPSSSAQAGTAFAQQPVVQLRDAANAAVGQSGVVVTATIVTGGGTLGGTTTATTNASGVASFTNLSITGSDGSRTSQFAAASLTSVTSTAIAVTNPPPPPPPSGLYPNRPASFTQASEIDFSQAIPSQPSDVDRPISGAPGWNMIYFNNNWTKTTDASAPQSAPGIWQGHWSPGSYGGGVIGAGGGHGIGNVFTYGPGNVFLTNAPKRLYLSMRVLFDFDASLWHPISNKFVNLEGDHSLILMQLREGGNWRHSEELGFGSPYTSFFVDGGTDQPGEDHIPGQVDNRAVPNRRWVQIELLIDIPNHIYKIWQDGVLTTNATPTFASTKITTVGIYAFRGGGGETLSTDLYYKYDHFFIAW